MSSNDQGFTGTGTAQIDTDTSTITVNSVNDQPLAAGDPSYATAEDTPLVISATTGVLANDSDPNDTPPTGTGPANTLSAVLVAPPSSGGTVTLNLNGSFVYTPGTNFVGSDTFTYRVQDNGGGIDGGDANGNDPIGNTVSVTVQVGGANDPPINNIPSSQFVNEDTDLTFNVANANRIFVDDPDASAGTIRIKLSAKNGTLTLSTIAGLSFVGGIGDGTADAVMQFTGTLAAVNTALTGMRFSPTMNFNGTASLTITTDDQGNTGTGGAKNDTDTLTITVRSANDPPVAVADGYITNEDTVLNVLVTNGVLFNDSDPNDSPANPLRAILQGPSVTVNPDGSSTRPTTNGTVTLRTDGSFTYTPALNFNGADSFTYRVTDTGGTANGGNDQGNVVTVSITVNAVNDAPVNTLTAAANVIEDTALIFSLGNGNAISVADVDVANGLLRINLTSTDGLLSLNGTAGLTFLSGDGLSDPSMIFTGTQANVNAALIGLTFLPDANFNSDPLGTNRRATVNITANDQGNSGQGSSQEDADTVFVTVVSVNDPPVAQGDFYTTSEDTPLTVTAPGVLFNDSDPLDNPANVLSASLITGATNGTLVFNSNGSFTYTPATNFKGFDSFTYRVQDNGGTFGGGINLGNTVTVTLGVGDVNDPPVNTVSGTQTMLEEGTLVFSSANGNRISTSDIDVGVSNLQVTLTAANGTLTLGGFAGPLHPA
jgi:VCBS repeat-containing protein